MRIIASVVVALCALVGSASAAGTSDPSFSNDGRLLINVQGRFVHGVRSEATSVVTLDDYSLVVGGTVWFYPTGGGYPKTRPVIAKVKRDGALDLSFGSSGLALPYIASWDSAEVDQINVWTDGRIVVSGSVETSWRRRMYVMRLTASGALDTSFAGTGYRVLPIETLDQDDTTTLHALVPYGKVVVAGAIDDSSRIALTRLDWNGNLDTTYSGTGSATRVLGYSTSELRAMLYTSRGEILLGASTFWSGPHGGPAYDVFRISYAGTLVEDIVPYYPFQQAYHLTLGGLAEDSQGRLIVTGTADHASSVGYGPPDRYMFVSRFAYIPAWNSYVRDHLYTPTEPDASSFPYAATTLFEFPGVDSSHGVAVATIGDKMVVGGRTSAGFFPIAQFEPEGAFDTSFSGDGRVQVRVTTDGPDEINALAITLDNLVIAAGKGGDYMAVVRLR